MDPLSQLCKTSLRSRSSSFTDHPRVECIDSVGHTFKKSATEVDLLKSEETARHALASFGLFLSRKKSI